MRAVVRLVAVPLLLGGFAVNGCGTAQNSSMGPDGGAEVHRQDPFEVRPFDPFIGDRWVGSAIAYGPFRDGQSPGGSGPSKEELAEDLHIMEAHWGLMRTYGSTGPTETLIEVIHEGRLDMKVMVGIWIAVEERLDEEGAIVERFPDAADANRKEIEGAVRLAENYPDVVIAVSVGNETQVSWSAHRSPPDMLINYVQEVRARTEVPVTVADDFNFWNKPESDAVAREVDFIVMHAHPLWNGLQFDEALNWTRGKVAEAQRAHPDRAIVLGETGWATRKHTEGDQARLMKGQPGEEEQGMFFGQVTAWADQERVPVFFFEAFDENWKGGAHPDEVEKHWGLFRADRTPKLAMSEALDP